jgi:4-hydroxythreonine-4-phosphate dehydrogenase
MPTQATDEPVQTLPRIALAMGDPAGISPELTAKVLADPAVLAAARLIVVGDRRVLEAGAEVAGVALDLTTVAADQPIPAAASRALMIDLGHCDPVRIARGRISRQGGAFARDNYLSAVALAQAGVVGAVTFTPFNKASMRQAVPGYDDEIAFTANAIGFVGEAREFNVLDGLWNARVTSHVPLKDVAGLLSVERIVDGLALTHAAMADAGFDPPRIAVAALNPHAGDNGNFGREEIDILEPAVMAAKARGIACEGPYPSDTVFVRARAGQFDGVMTMYHDQGQIAMKLIGFDKGVTLLGGLPFPVCTPAHGTAFDIAGNGIANVGATRNAVLLAARMAARRGAPLVSGLSLTAARHAIGLSALEKAS